jgi:diguanylate cyclase (GGDEF)-like protein
MAVFLFCYTAHWMNWLDYHQLILLTHIGYVLVIIYFSYCVIRKMMMKTTKEKKHHLTGPIFIFLGVLIDIINLNFDSRVDNSMFTRIGVLVFFILEGMQIIEKMIRQYKEGIKLQFVSRLAYHDGLTDLLNRTSFMEEQDKIEKEHSFGLIAMFDVNDLKKMNDNYGHTKGDELIITVAHAIQHIFGELGKCYRIGGDEFVLLSHKSCTEEQFLEKKKMLPDYLKKQSEEKGFPISVAIGYTVYDEEKHHCFHDFLNEADNLMYEDKKRIKEARA